MRTRTFVLALAAALLVLLAAAPAAYALKVSVRAEGATFQVMPTTVVDHVRQAAGRHRHRRPFLHEHGRPHGHSGQCSVLGNASSGASRGTSASSSYGLFLNSIGGLGGRVRRPIRRLVGVHRQRVRPVRGSRQGCPARAGDSYVFFQNPDGSGTLGGKLLVVRVSALVIKKGRALKITVVGDDLAKANSAADAKRFGTTEIETPAQFAAVDGATLHVGNRVYALTGSSVTIKDLPVGTFAVWAEKAMDTSFVYVVR